MNRILLINYIKRLKKQDIINFANNQNISLTDDEVDVIYDYVKNRYLDFLDGNREELLRELKSKVSCSTYSKILEYYQLYQDKI